MCLVIQIKYAMLSRIPKDVDVGDARPIAVRLAFGRMLMQ